jgi:ketosteroid isomerase-like protein
MTASLLIVATLAFAVAAPPVSAPSPAEAEVQLRAINHRITDAYRRSDPQYMEKLTSRDFLFTDSDGRWLDRAAFLARLRGSAPFAGVAYDDVQVRLFGEVAVLHGVFHARTPMGEDARVRYTDVYARENGHWRLVSGQNTPTKAGASMDDGAIVPPVIANPWQGEDPISDDTEVLTTLNEQYVQAFRDADVAWYDAHLAPDYQVVFGDGSIHDRAAALADFAKPYFAEGIAAFPLDKVRIRRFGDVALVHAENAYTLKDGRKGVNRYTDIWVKQKDSWWCVAAHITVHKAPAK